MPVTFILNVGIFLIFLCGIVAGWCCHHLGNARHFGLKKCMVLMAGALMVAFVSNPAHAQKTWKLVSPGPCEGGGGSGSEIFHVITGGACSAGWVKAFECSDANCARYTFGSNSFSASAGSLYLNGSWLCGTGGCVVSVCKKE